MSQIYVVTAADALVLIHDKSVQVTSDNPADDPIKQEINTISFPITEEQYQKYDTLKVDYKISDPAAGLFIYLTTDESYELCKKGYGITDLGIGNPPLFGSGSAAIRVSKNFKSGNNNLKIYSMVRPFGSKADVTYSVSLIKTTSSTPTQMVTPTLSLHSPTQTPTIPTTTTVLIVTTSTTPIVSPTTKATVKPPTPLPTNTPTQSSPLGIEIGIIATLGSAILVMKRK